MTVVSETPKSLNNHSISITENSPSQSQNTKEEKTSGVFNYLKNAPDVAFRAFNYLRDGIYSVFTDLKNSLYVAGYGLVGYGLYKVYQYICDVSVELDEIFNEIYTNFSQNFSFSLKDLSLEKISSSIANIANFMIILYQTFFEAYKIREAQEKAKEYFDTVDPLGHLKPTDTDNKYMNIWNKDLNYNYIKRIVNYGSPYYESLSTEAKKLYTKVFKFDGEYKSTNVAEYISSSAKSFSSILNNALTKLKSAALADYLVCLSAAGAGFYIFKAISNYCFASPDVDHCDKLEKNKENGVDENLDLENEAIGKCQANLDS